MKKVLYSIVILLSLFLFNGKVEAFEQNKSYLCYYESEEMDFVVRWTSTAMYGDYQDADVAVYPVKKFEINGKEYSSGAGKASPTWRDSQLKVYGENRQLHSDDKCYNYLYFDEVSRNFIIEAFAGIASDDKLYFSDEYLEIDGVDLVLTKAEYEESSENAILEELICSYGGLTSEINSYKLWDIPTITFKIQSGAESGIGSYEVFTNGIDSLYSKSYASPESNITYIISDTEYVIEDHFHIRLFWDDETSTWSCPANIAIGLVNKNGLFVDTNYRELAYTYEEVNEYTDKKGFFEEDRTVVIYPLNEDASYVKYEQAAPEQGPVCVFSKEGDIDWSLSLVENVYLNGDKKYKAYKKGGTQPKAEIKIPTGIISTDCSGLPIIYTDCLKESRCIISTEFFADSIKLVSNEKANSEDKDTVVEGMGQIDGEKFKQLICNLSGKLNKSNKTNLLNTLLPFHFYDANGTTLEEKQITSLDCESWGHDDSYECRDNDCSNITYIIDKQISETRKYCNSIYDVYMNNTKTSWSIARKNECIQFQKVYNELVDKGMVTDFSTGCNMMTNDLKDKLVWILDLIKIVGPILAVGLGTLDFIKVLASGDADSEMKKSFKRFMTRIAAAILLFIIPVIISFMLDIFLEEQEGYDSDNPFCKIVDLNE